jgi:hypothetical protein
MTMAMKAGLLFFHKDSKKSMDHSLFALRYQDSGHHPVILFHMLSLKKYKTYFGVSIRNKVT